MDNWLIIFGILFLLPVVSAQVGSGGGFLLDAEIISVGGGYSTSDGFIENETTVIGQIAVADINSDTNWRILEGFLHAANLSGNRIVGEFRGTGGTGGASSEFISQLLAGFRNETSALNETIKYLRQIVSRQKEDIAFIGLIAIVLFTLLILKKQKKTEYSRH